MTLCVFSPFYYSCSYENLPAATLAAKETKTPNPSSSPAGGDPDALTVMKDYYL